MQQNNLFCWTTPYCNIIVLKYIVMLCVQDIDMPCLYILHAQPYNIYEDGVQCLILYIQLTSIIYIAYQNPKKFHYRNYQIASDDKIKNKVRPSVILELTKKVIAQYEYKSTLHDSSKKLQNQFENLFGISFY